MWTYIKKVINTEYLVLFISVGILSLSSAQMGIHFYKSKQLWLFCFIFIGFHFLSRFTVIQKYFIDIFKKFIASKLCVFTFSISFLLLFFLYTFPLNEWGSYILVDDYAPTFADSMLGFEILKQGGYYGWSSSFYGGFFTASNSGTNLIHFLLPLSFLGWETGFHLMILLFFLGFPFLCFYYVRICCGENSNRALVVLPIATFFVLTYFRDILRWGMVSSFIGVDLIILSLILFQRLKDNKRYSFFFLTFTLSLLFYTHIPMFIYGIMFILIDFLITPNKRDFKYICYLGGLLLIIAFPFFIYKIKYSAYIILSHNYFPSEFSLSAYLMELPKNYRLLFNITNWSAYLTALKLFYPLLFLPVLIYMFFHKKWRKQVIFALFIPILFPILPPTLRILFSRALYTMPFLMSILLAGFLIINYEKKHFVILLMGLSLSLVVYSSPYFVAKPFIFPHGKPGNFYNKPLVETIKTLDGRYIAIENNQHFLAKPVVPAFHWLGLLQLETNKLFFSNYHDGYPNTPYRGNSFESGFFRGKVIDEWAIEDINNVLLKWGIKYLVVWHDETKKYFNNQPQFFEKNWQDTDWIIFRFKNADIRSAVVDNNGKAIIIDNDFFKKQVILSNSQKGSKVVLRTNYFPAWKAYYNNKEIPLINFQGQIGFIAPDSGDYKVEMKYPRYTILNILAIIAIMLSGFLSYKRILP